MVSALPPVMLLATKTCAERSVEFGATPHCVGPRTEVYVLLPPGWLSVTLEIVAPPKRRKSTIVSPEPLGALKETVPELLPVELEPGALCTSTGGAPLSATVAPLPLAGGLLVPEMEFVPAVEFARACDFGEAEIESACKVIIAVADCVELS